MIKLPVICCQHIVELPEYNRICFQPIQVQKVISIKTDLTDLKICICTVTRTMEYEDVDDDISLCCPCEIFTWYYPKAVVGIFTYVSISCV